VARARAIRARRARRPSRVCARAAPRARRTGTPAIPGKQIPIEAITEMAKRLMSGEVPALAKIAYDLTPKPPGTTEWE
jgi:GMP synthase PP-ATPase subunit